MLHISMRIYQLSSSYRFPIQGIVKIHGTTPEIDGKMALDSRKNIWSRDNAYYQHKPHSFEEIGSLICNFAKSIRTSKFSDTLTCQS